jgi:hypothetical protein
MDGFHIKGMTKDKSYLLLPTKVSHPVPGEHTLNTNDQVIQVRFNYLHKRLGIGFDVLVDQDISLLVEDADIEASGMQINSAVMLMCLRVEFH